MWDATFRKIMQAIVIATGLIALISLASVVFAAIWLYLSGATVPPALENTAFGIVGSFMTLLGTLVKPVVDALTVQSPS